MGKVFNINLRRDPTLEAFSGKDKVLGLIASTTKIFSMSYLKLCSFKAKFNNKICNRIIIMRNKKI